ncbi:methylenetetrahydromethanopterin reductase [Nocardioides dokdonensis FR1436]|uniref:Methylenetetrahydromethanopterin reductase n=1 Tax=Nocardioides dokdonensis FR1436 TaxID=1300347 RepID=A0A1A9GL02_9ACTN|nr:TIGR03617 family F420-dependent LLM class oxidoreductase [Nocardioides dokdonensis]ANH38273.1 methylenetetrahydromethanopterin reductase [Nocardioides dokdonensis FR1436]
MEIVASLPQDTALRDVGATVRRIEALGVDTVHVPETVHDSLQVALLAVEHSDRLTVRTSMTLAFPRSPMTTAYAAWDLARFSGGRFQLGLATQVRGNIVGRFSMPWGDPAGRLADYVGALRAIFAAFQAGGPLLHEGPYYRFDRLQPYFNPGPLDVAAPQIYTGGVNRRTCEAAGAASDGFVTHATNSHPTYLRERVLPALAAGAEQAGRTDGGPRVVIVSKAITAPDEERLVAAREEARREMAFLWSTPAYRPTLELLGHGDLPDRLGALVRAERWDDLGAVLSEEVLDDLVPQGTYDRLPAVLGRWYAGLADGLAVGLPAAADRDDELAALVQRCRAIPARGSADLPARAVDGGSDS